MEISEYKHRIPLQIRFNDVDLFGHINNSVYVQFFDMGKLAYFKQFMGGNFEHEPSVPVVADIHCVFHAPSYIDDKLSVLTAITSIGESSMVLEQVIVDGKGNAKCSAKTVMVNVNARTHQPTPVTEGWRSTLSEFEGKEL